MTELTLPKPSKCKELLKNPRVLLKRVTLGYLVVLIVLILVVRWCGERTWITGTAIYLPATALLLPLVLLTPLCVRFHRKLCWLHLVAFILAFSIYQQPHFSVSGAAVGRKIRIVTNNIGQRKPASVTPFIKEHDPDIIAFQESNRLEKFLRNEYPNRNIAVHEEFALVSKWPIKKAGYVPGLFSHFGYAAAWFEVDCDGKPLIVYNVHMPTPRPEFLKFRGRGFLYSLVRGEGIFSSKFREEYKQAMRDRVEEGEKLADLLAKETRPYIALGDFNMPDTGYLHRVFTSRLTDVFAAKGNGYGLTFPGFTRNPLSLFGPWLRIDYIFADRRWRPLDCERESRQNAQHLAIAAELELINDK